MGLPICPGTLTTPFLTWVGSPSPALASPVTSGSAGVWPLPLPEPLCWQCLAEPSRLVFAFRRQAPLSLEESGGQEGGLA